MLDVDESLRNIINALHQEDTVSLLLALRALHAGHNQNAPNLDPAIATLKNPQSARLVQALKTAVEKNYVSGMIVLLDPQRVQQVLQNVDPQIHSEGITNLKFVAAVFEDNTDGIANVWCDFVLGENGAERSITNVIDFLKTYRNASERYMVEQERQRLEQIVEGCSKINQIKKM